MALWSVKFFFSVFRYMANMASIKKRAVFHHCNGQ